MAMNYAVASVGKSHRVYWVSFARDSGLQDEPTIQAKLISPATAPAGTPTADVALVCSDPLMRTYGTNFVQAAKKMGMTTMHEFAEWHHVHKGNLCFGPDFTQLFRKAAGYVDQIIGPTNTPVAKLPIVSANLEDCKPTP
jgi:hypothetical protein